MRILKTKKNLCILFDYINARKLFNMQLSGSFWQKNKKVFLTGIFASSSVISLFYLLTNKKTDNELQSSYNNAINNELKLKLSNKPPHYIQAPNIENLVSLARYTRTLLRLNYYANSKSGIQPLIDELDKLSSAHDENDLFNNASATISIHKSKMIINKKETKRTGNPFLHDGLAEFISQQLSDQFMIKMALKAPYIDNRFFRNEPPSTVKRLNKVLLRNTNVDLDTDYSLIFEFYNSFAAPILDSPKDYKLFHSNKHLRALLNRLKAEINALNISEYSIADRAKLNIWSSDGHADDDDETNAAASAAASKSLKQKQNFEFVQRNELLLMSCLESMCNLSIEEFVRMNGLELLLIVYEKHKYKQTFLNSIGNCLSLLSLNREYIRLFVFSGWLKRLNQMCNKKMFGFNTQSERELEAANAASAATSRLNDSLNNIDSIREMIAHKILFNLNQFYDEEEKRDKNYEKIIQAKEDSSLFRQLRLFNSSDENNSIRYSTMLFPLYPTFSSLLRQNKHLLEYDRSESKADKHQHVVDIVFIHGLKGSVYKTWRQDEQTNKKEINNSTANKNLIEIKLGDEESNQICYNWPREWLAADLISSDSDESSTVNEDDLTEKFRIIGVNYESLYSLWETQNSMDEKKLKLTIKERAVSLAEQLRLAHVGTRPIVWVCHSMGGLIVKQILVHLEELKNSGKKNNKSGIVDNTKSIIFLSTPHLGSSVAKTVSDFSFAFLPSKEIYELIPNNSYLVDLNRKFLMLLRSGMKEGEEKYKLLSLVEELPTYFAFNVYAKTVTETSADIGAGEFYLALGRDHLNICKPVDKACFVYRKILSLIDQIIQFENLNCQKCKQEIHFDEKALKRERYFELFSNQFKNF